MLKKQLDCIGEDFLRGIFTGLAKPAWGALTHLFGRVTTGKSTLVTDIARHRRTATGGRSRRRSRR